MVGPTTSIMHPLCTVQPITQRLVHTVKHDRTLDVTIDGWTPYDGFHQLNEITCVGVFKVAVPYFDGFEFFSNGSPIK